MKIYVILTLCLVGILMNQCETIQERSEEMMEYRIQKEQLMQSGNEYAIDRNFKG